MTVALPKPAPKKNTQSAIAASQYYEGNVQLMEARFLELSSSIRALYRSVEELRDFCKDEDNDADHIVVEAIFENLGVLRKQRKELVTIVGQMNQLHAHTDVPDDIRIMVLGEEEENKPITSANSSTTAGAYDTGVYL
jgi:hypothetical protein